MKKDSFLQSHETEIIESRTVHDGVFRLSVHRLRYAGLRGGLRGPVTREVFDRGNSVAVLPYDPARDSVLLIRQFLVGAFFAGRPTWSFHVITGHVNAEESEEDAGRRETIEEAGCGIQRLIAGPAFLPSPGASSERVFVFCGEADLTNCGGLHGLASEGEDIAAEALPVSEALRLLDAGLIEAGPAVVALHWFARQHANIRMSWLSST